MEFTRWAIPKLSVACIQQDTGRRLALLHLGLSLNASSQSQRDPCHVASARRAERCSMLVGSAYNQYTPESKVPLFLNVSVSETTLCHPN